MFNDGEVRIGTSIDTSGFEKDAKTLKKEAEQVDREVSQSLTKTTKVGNSLSSSLGKVTKKIVGLGSALFDVVAVGGLLGAMGTGAFILYKALEKANGKTEQLKANLSYIGFVASKIFENLLLPAIDKTTSAINGLVGALYKMVVYVGYILSAWTGKDLFAGTSAKDYAKSMEDANKSAKSTAKSTKQIKKDLMSFDEVNKLSDNTSANVGGTGTKVTLPNLPNLGEVPIPGWVKWIAENKDKIIEVAKWVLAILTFNKVVSWLEPLGNFFGMFSNGNIAKNLGLTGGQLGLIVGSLLVIAGSIHKIKEDMHQTYEDIKEIWEHGDEELDDWLKEDHSVDEVQDRLNQKQSAYNGILEEQKDLGYQIVGDRKKDYQITKRALVQQDKLLDYKIAMWRNGQLTKEQEEQLVDELFKQRDELERISKEYSAMGIDTTDLYEKSLQYKDVIGEIGVKVDDTNRYMDYSVDSIDRFGFKAGQANTKVGEIGSSVSGIAEGITGADKKTSTWGSTVSGVADAIARINKTNIQDKTFNINAKLNITNVGSTVKEIGTKLAQTMSTLLIGLNTKNIAQQLVDKVRSLKLARGGIIHNPGAGVSLGSNIIGGEGRNAEAVLPLDDRTMDRLGQSIARHMTINATMINQMNGRTLSREVKQIMSENDFANNL